VRGLIALRRAHPAFRLSTRSQVKSALEFIPAQLTPPQTIAYRLEGGGVGDSWRQILVVLHGGRQAGEMALPDGEWSVAVDGRQASPVKVGTVRGMLLLEPLSATVLFRE
jgi:pullulanase